MSEPLQRTDEWRAQRAGKQTASRFSDVISLKRDGTPTAQRSKYMRELAFERLSGNPVHEINGKALGWGTEVEKYGREAFELETGFIVSEAGFMTHPDYPHIGCSVDGTISEDGGFELKCPFDEAVHVQTWLEGMPDDHMAQVQGAMLITGRKYWMFCSFDPRAADQLKLYTQRIDRDENYIGYLLKKLIDFESELQEMVNRLQKLAA